MFMICMDYVLHNLSAYEIGLASDKPPPQDGICHNDDILQEYLPDASDRCFVVLLQEVKELCVLVFQIFVQIVVIVHTAKMQKEKL